MRGNRDFVGIVGNVAPAGWAESLLRVRVSAAARFALLSASRFPPPSQSADAPCDTVAAPCFCCAGRRLLANLDGGPNSVSAAPAAGSGLTALCLARFCRRQQLGLRSPAHVGGYKDLKKWPCRIPIKQDTAGPFWRTYSALHYRPRACGAQYGECPVDTGQALAKELDRLAPLLQERDGIACKTLPNGSGGRVYAFTRPAKAPAARPAR